MKQITHAQTARLGMLCFTAGTYVLTPYGDVPVAELQAGDLVCTRDNGAVPVAWAGAQILHAAQLQAAPELCPFVVKSGGWAGDLGLLASPEHCLTAKFDGIEMVIRAKHLAQLRSGKVWAADPTKGVTYIHLKFEKHQAIYANGIITEPSFHGSNTADTANTVRFEDVRRAFRPLLRPDLNESYGGDAPLQQFQLAG